MVFLSVLMLGLCIAFRFIDFPTFYKVFCNFFYVSCIFQTFQAFLAFPRLFNAFFLNFQTFSYIVDFRFYSIEETEKSSCRIESFARLV
jgi:hypothetical protein